MAVPLLIYINSALPSARITRDRFVEIRTYEGDGRDVAQLIEQVWPSIYGGNTWVPVWDWETLRWQILSSKSLEARDYLVAAYDGVRLVGCLFAEPWSISSRGTPLPGSLLSWFTVDPQAGSPLLAIQLVQEMLRRHAEHNAVLSLGYVMGKPNSPAFRFWCKYAELFPQTFRFLRKVGFWARVLDPQAVSQAGLTPLERYGSHLLRLWQPAWPISPPSSTIRDYQPGDLADCLALIERQQTGIDLGLVWSGERLQQHLTAGDISRTKVCESPAVLKGVLNWHRLTFFGKSKLQSALIDLCAGSCSLAESSALVRHGLEEMRADGLQIAIMLRQTGCPTGALLANGFLPLPSQDHLVGLFPEPFPAELPTRRMSVMLR